MDIFFDNPNDPPVPPDEVAIRNLTVKPYEDGRRVAVDFEITPFQEKPNLEIDVHNKNGDLVATFSVVEAIEPKMSFTLHLREESPRGGYTLSMVVFYTDLAAMDEEQGTIGDILIENKRITDSSQITFSI
jgi:hypothetical protein